MSEIGGSFLGGFWDGEGENDFWQERVNSNIFGTSRLGAELSGMLAVALSIISLFSFKLEWLKLILLAHSSGSGEKVEVRLSCHARGTVVYSKFVLFLL